LVTSGIGVQKLSANLRVLPIEVVVLGGAFLLFLGIGRWVIKITVTFSFSQNGIGT